MQNHIKHSKVGKSCPWDEPALASLGATVWRAGLLECLTVSDWRQIQARIRKAKTSSEPAAQLAKLFERTRDAMAAFELAAVEERAGNSAEAIRWYTTAAQRFRRADWKTKAHDGLTRLGAAIPETPSPDAAPALPQEAAEPVLSSSTFTFVARVETSDATEAKPWRPPMSFFAESWTKRDPRHQRNRPQLWNPPLPPLKAPRETPATSPRTPRRPRTPQRESACRIHASGSPYDK